VDVAFSHWSASWPVLIGYLAVAAAHLVGLRGLLAADQALPGTEGRRQLTREALVFQAGLLVVLVALISPVEYLSGVYIWVRALQVLLLAVVGPGLIVLGAPWSSFAQLRWPRSQQALGRGLDADDHVDRVSWLVARPVLAVVAFNVVFLAWQLPVLFELARTNSGAALAEHVSYLAAGTLFWLQLISSRPLSQHTPPLRRITLLVGTVGVSTVLGMMLVFGSGVLYSGYANSAHHLVTVLDDQQLSGAILWMGMLPPLVIAGVALLMEWFNNEESAELSVGLDRLLTPRRHNWPSRPVRPGGYPPDSPRILQ
jgi:putative membrane protein